MHIVRENQGRLQVMPVAERHLLAGLGYRILKHLAMGDAYPKEISRALRVPEQKVYYHIRQLERKGLIQVARREEKGGALAKVYALSSPSFVVRLGEFQDAARVPLASPFAPFIHNGRFDARIVVGSPDPHGPERARSRDAAFAVDLALFLGTFLTAVERPVVAEDTDVHPHDLQNNLIIIGGPVTNKVTKMVNHVLPVRFDKGKNIVAGRRIFKADECGFVALANNPFAAGKKIMVIAGKRYSGTKAAVLACVQHFDVLRERNFVVVEGVDNDGDGEVDGVKIVA